MVFQNRISPIQKWHTEKVLKAFIVIFSIVLWVALTVSIVGILYALLVALAGFFIHICFITYVRGSAVKIGPNQFPDLYNRVVDLCNTAGMEKMPDIYLMQANGALNAMATKFLRSKMIILYSDLLEACGKNIGAQDMIIGHEIGHLKEGHLDWYWFLLPGLFTPFLPSLTILMRHLSVPS